MSAAIQCGACDVPSSEVIEDELRAVVTDFNAADGDPEERARLLAQIRTLRTKLAAARCAEAVI